MEPNRTTLLNHLVIKHNLKRYLEIGVQNPDQNFNKILCEYKVSVDPDPNAHATFCMDSDQFFSANNPIDYIDVTTKDSAPLHQTLERDKRFSLIFIDGLHTAEQVKKDFENALKFLSPNGFIVLHDCNPLKEEHTIVPRPTERGHWNGDVYKFAAALLHKKKFTVDIDNGCMVCPGNREKYQILYEPLSTWTWDLFDKNRHSINLISWDEFISANPHI